jgi:hypothetical protein
MYSSGFKVSPISTSTPEGEMRFILRTYKHREEKKRLEKKFQDDGKIPISAVGQIPTHNAVEILLVADRQKQFQLEEHIILSSEMDRSPSGARTILHYASL